MKAARMACGIRVCAEVSGDTVVVHSSGGEDGRASSYLVWTWLAEYDPLDVVERGTPVE